MNIYDVRLVDDYPACGMNWPPDLADVYPYLRVRPDPLHYFFIEGAADATSLPPHPSPFVA